MTAATDPQIALAALRQQIDDVDGRLVGLVAERMRCVEQVIAVKQQTKLPARIDSRVEEVVGRVRVMAEQAGAPADLAETLWRTMIDWVIAYEERHLDASAMKL